jgi:hypothetical protein
MDYSKSKALKRLQSVNALKIFCPAMAAPHLHLSSFSQWGASLNYYSCLCQIKLYAKFNRLGIVIFYTWQDFVKLSAIIKFTLDKTF